MNVTGPTELRYKGWANQPGRALLWTEPSSGTAAVVDPADNPGTSVTNAVEQVIDLLRATLGADTRVFTLSRDPIAGTAAFEVDLDEFGQPHWTPVPDFGSAPTVVRHALSYVNERAQIAKGVRRDEVARVRTDEPIVSADQDRLGRRGFAEAIAEDIRQAPREGGFVLAVTGPWGEGKTSVINLVTQELTRSGDAELLQFNPWLFSGTEQLVEHFFDELSGQLEETRSERFALVAQALRRYGQVVRPLRAAPLIGTMAEVSADIANEVAEAAAPGVSSARSRASDLRRRLTELDRRILVVVDDLDRLRADEIGDVVRLVRLVGDFPNLVYVLAFDRPRVEKALGSDASDGRAYLEKIVQVTHALPQAQPEEIAAVLSEELSAVIGDTDRFTFNRDHFQNVFWGGTRQFFRTLRDVRRFINVLPATLELIGDEVDLADLLALEALRLFVPSTFDLIASHTEAFTTPSGQRLATSDDEVATETVAATQNAGPFSLRFLIGELFPAASRHLGGAHYGSDWLSTWERERRVAHPSVLRTYFQRRVPSGKVRTAVMSAIFESLEDGERLDRLLASLSSDELEQALARLQGYERDFPRQHPEVMLSVLSRHSRRLRRGSRRVMDLGADVELGRVFYRVLRSLDPDRIEGTLEASEFADLSTRYEAIRIVGHRDGSGHKLVAVDAAERLETGLADDIVRASARDLADEPDVGPLLGFLLEQRGDEGRALVRKWAADDHFFVAFLRSRLLISVGQTMGKYDVRRVVVLNWPSLVDVLSGELVKKRAAHLDQKWVAEQFDEDAVSAITQALYFAEHPEEGAAAVSRWMGGGDDET